MTARAPKRRGQPQGIARLRAETGELRRQLQEAQETLRAIRDGTVDAFVVHEDGEHRVYTVAGADRPYRLLIEQMGQGALTLYADGTIAYANLQMASMLGVAHSRLIGAPLRAFVPDADQAAYDELLALGQAGASEGELHLRRAVGTAVPVYLTFNALPEDSGTSVGVLVTDLTAQKHHEQLAAAQAEIRAAHDRLQASEAQLVAELHGMTRLHEVSMQLGQPGDRDALLLEIVDAAIAVTRADMGAIQLLERQGGAVRLAASRGFAPRFPEAFQSASAAETACGVAAKHWERVVVDDLADSPIFAGTPAGEELAAAGVRAMQSTPLLGRFGRFVGVLSTHYRTVHPLTERDFRLLDLLARQAADWIERLEAEHALREADRAKDEFLAMLSHELRNPLGAIGSAVRIIETVAHQDPLAARAHAVIDRQVGHLARLVEDLLDVGRVTAGKITLTRSVVDVGPLVARLVNAWRVSGRFDRHRVSVVAAPAWADADETRLEQVVSNLLGNALKFTPAGGTIGVRVGSHHGEVVLEVQDNGIGIPANLIDRVFDLFVQGERPPDRAQGGLGIGLTLVRNVVEQHGGSITARSAGQDRGSTFTVRLPAVPPPPDHGAVMPDRHGDEPRRILVVEDNDDARDMLRLWLEQSGHTVGTAATGGEGIEMAVREPPDIALVDIGLPGLDGYGVARALRNALGDRVTLVALTGYGGADDRGRARRAGFDVHLVKPVNPAELDQVIATAARHPA